MNKKNIGIAVSFAICTLLMYFVLKRIGFENIPQYIGQINPVWIVAAILAYTADMVVRAKRWQEILKDSGVHISLWDSFLAYNLGNSLNIIIPAKIGDAARSYYVKNKYRAGYVETLPSIFLDRIFDVIGVYIVILICSIYVIARVELQPWFYNLMLLGIAALLAVFAALEVFMRNSSKILGIKNEKMQKLLLSLVDAFKGSVRQKRKFARLTAYSILIWLFEGICAIFVFASLGQHLNPVIIIFASMTATLTKVIPVTPGGIGVFEGTMMLVFTMFGYGGSLIGMISTLLHLVMNVYTLAVGMYALVSQNISIKNIEEKR